MDTAQKSLGASRDSSRVTGNAETRFEKKEVFA